MKNDKESIAGDFDTEQNGLRMAPGAMLDLARRAAELIVERIESLAEEGAWDGEFRQELVDQLLEDPPESGLPALQVIERAARGILPVAARIDHPRFFGFIPSSPTWPGVVADFMAAGYHVNQCTWLTSSGPSQLELVVLEWFRRWVGYPDSAGGLLTSGGSAASLDAFVAAREAAGHPSGPRSTWATRVTARRSGRPGSSASGLIASAGWRATTASGPDMEALRRAVDDDRAAGSQSHRGVRQRRGRQHRSHRSAGRDGGLLRSGRPMAPRRCGLRRFRGDHG